MGEWDDKFQMSDDEWRRANAPVRLPECARGEIDWAIGLFRTFQRAARARDPQGTKKSLARVQKRTRALLKTFDALDQESIQTMLLPSPKEAASKPFHSPSHLPAMIERLEALRGEIKSLDTWLDAALKRVSRKPTRSSDNLVWLVGRLDGILRRHRESGVTRSYKNKTTVEFVDNVVCIADPDIGPGSVEEAIKAVVKKRSGKQRGDDDVGKLETDSGVNPAIAVSV